MCRRLRQIFAGRSWAWADSAALFLLRQQVELDLAEPSDDDEPNDAELYGEDDNYEKKWLVVQHEFDKLQTNYRRLQNVNEALKRQIEAGNKQQAEYLSAKQEAERVAHEAELRMEKMHKTGWHKGASLSRLTLGVC